MQKDLVKTESPKCPMKTHIQDLMSIIAAFSKLLTKETEALKKADFKAVDTLQADKKMFAKQYNAKATAISERRDELMTLDLALREKFMNERTKFSALLNDNMRALELSQNSTKRLVDRILEAARRSVMQQQQMNYSSTGKATGCKSDTMSLAVNQSL